MQSSDPVVLPEAVVDFNKLVDLLLDGGARFSPPGIHSLSDLGAQTPAGTTMMAMGSVNVMTVSNPGTHYPAVAVKLHWTSDLQSTSRNSDSLPSTSIEVKQLGNDTPMQPIIIQMGEEKIQDYETNGSPEESNIGATLIDIFNQNGIDRNV